MAETIKKENFETTSALWQNDYGTVFSLEIMIYPDNYLAN